LKNGIKIGDRMKIPAHMVFHKESGHSGKVVYVSEDGNTVTIQCDKKHEGKIVSLKVRINSQK
jgi:hypothetical protein